MRPKFDSIHIWGNNPHGVEITARRTMKGRGGDPDSFSSQVHLAAAGGYFFTEICVLPDAPEQTR